MLPRNDAGEGIEERNGERGQHQCQDMNVWSSERVLSLLKLLRVVSQQTFELLQQ